MTHSMVRTYRQLFQGLERDDGIFAFNLKLDSLSKISSLNENVLEEMLGQLNGYRGAEDDLYWLTLARINELVLVCAGNYANNCEFRLVGDLLLNPRCILVHVRGSLQPVRKIRHMALTEHFRHVAETRL
jgi:hypothetical protein